MKSELIPKIIRGNISISLAGTNGLSVSESGKVELGLWVNIPSKSGTIVILTSYYTITGQKLSNMDNIKGYILLKKIFSDGTISITKIFKNNK